MTPNKNIIKPDLNQKLESLSHQKPSKPIFPGKKKFGLPLSYSLVLSTIVFLSVVVSGLGFNLINSKSAKPANIAQASNSSETTSQSGGEITRDIKSLSDQKTIGQVSIKKVDEKVSQVNIKYTADQNEHPVYLRLGQCSNPNEAIKELKPISRGMSDNTIEKTISEILSGPTILLVHESKANFNNYIGCATIK